MTTPLNRLIDELNYPCLTESELDAFVAGEGLRLLFLTGDPVTNLETNDVAAILPELAKAFDGGFVAAVVGRAAEDRARERFQVWPVPSLLFVEHGRLIGRISRVRDWQDYLDETRAIIDAVPPSATLIAREGAQ
ncbi:hypothetical protein ACUN9Y_10245 [Halomonas sp. V046]|uniref:hypothetical protein n=1 Tax=Halomonas sp. V046 TaxID=3459611 RepID=UPI0040445C98